MLIGVIVRFRKGEGIEKRGVLLSSLSVEAMVGSDDHVTLTQDTLDLDALYNRVVSPSAGAVSTFVGTTRDTFDSKRVVRLEYEAYEEMAVKELHRLCEQVRSKWVVKKIAVAHRLGIVSVGEASVIIAISSTHRKEAIEACHFAIDELKARVPIWKKECYEDGSTWKANAESTFHG